MKVGYMAGTGNTTNTILMVAIALIAFKYISKKK